MDPISLLSLAHVRRHFTPPADLPAAPPPAAPPSTPPAPPAAPPAPAPEPKSYDEAYVKQLRDEAAGHRTKLKDLETRPSAERQQLAQLLGLDPAAPADPKVLQEQLGLKDKELRSLRVESALEKSIRTHGADSDLLSAVLKGTGQLRRPRPLVSHLRDRP